MTPDELYREDAAAPPRRTKSGPRHAAPRKPLLTRLHVPASKAIALAAMPSAVLMGMGLTPRLALAEPLPKNPFQDGPCVTAPDREAEKDGDREAGEGESSRDDRDDRDDRDEQAGGEAKPGTTPEPGTTAPAGPLAGGTGSGGAGGGGEEAGTPEPEPSPSETGKRDPLDPLGIGDAIKDLFTPDDGDDGEGREDGEAGVATEPSAPPSPSRSGQTGDGGSDTPVKDAAGEAREEAAGEPVDDAAAPRADASGKEPFPCPAHDAEALAEAEEERTEAVLPNAPWLLETSLLALHGLDYQGIVKVRTHNGTVKNVLKFTARSVDIRDLHQLVEGPGGSTAHVRAARGSTSTIRDGTVTMYTEELKGKLFGLVPITFSPESPPPLNIPEVFFTDVSVRQAGQFGGELHIPGMNLYND
ncbi:hydrogenase expression protein HypF [Streptomyces sp. CNQ085]|uniref:hydrogenase expression protein HypF n=1 Tax=Streptomyces sp. CNQ085 TaxID=2886944 RepID=UPI001F51087A|nr:hydrogenase expression protein HypF [Streptomyces sp. CNQ085]MCI0384951.1 hydrogenase expression protein HypF [Streptomyces sp. CNQ085]